MEKNRPIFLNQPKQLPKYKARFWTAYVGENVKKCVAQGTAIFGYFISEPTKSSLIGETSPNLVTLVGRQADISSYPAVSKKSFF